MRLSLASFLVPFVIACGGDSSNTSPDGGGGGGDADGAIEIDAAPLAPVIDEVTPPSGTVGIEITIAGSNFGDSHGTSTIEIAGVEATVVSWSDTSITATVPDVTPAVREVVVTNAGGNATSNFEVVLPKLVFMQTGNGSVGGSAGLVVMAFDADAGTLVEVADSPYQLGSAAASYGGCAQTVFVHRATRRVFVATSTAFDVFDINPTTGALTPVTNSPLTIAASSYGLDVSNDGSLAVVANYSGTVTSIAISAGGAVSEADTAPAAGAVQVVITGNWVAAMTNDDNLHTFSLATDGTLTAAASSPQSIAGIGWTMIKRPVLAQVYMAGSGDVHVASIDGSSGAATVIADSPFTTGISYNAPSMAVRPDGMALYIADNSSDLHGYGLAGGGAPTALAGSPFDTGLAASNGCAAVDSKGEHLVITGDNIDSVSVMALDADGIPTALGNSPFALTTTGTSTQGVALSF